MKINKILVNLIIVSLFAQIVYAADTTFSPGNLTVPGDINVTNKVYGKELCIGSDCRTVWPSTTDTNESARVGNLALTDCPSGQLVIGIQDNGTVLCATDSSSIDTQKIGGGIYLFNGSTAIYVNDTQLNSTINNRIDNKALNLNVNSSNYWDNLNTPNDISSSQFWYNHTNTAIQETDKRYLNLSGSNANSNINIGSFNLTANRIFGVQWSDIANKFIETVSSIYLFMEGTTLKFNDTQLNSTIDNRKPKDGSLNSTAWNRTGSNVFLSNENDKVGIGLVNPNHTLHTVGNVSLNHTLFITEGGRIGVGTNSPTVKLDILQNSAIRLGNTYISSGSGGNYAHFANNIWYDGSSWISTGTVGALLQMTGQHVVFYTHNGLGTFTETFRIASNGNVGIGVSNPSAQLELSLDSAVKPNGGQWTSPSDERTKTNVSNFTLGLDSLRLIRPVNYNYNGKAETPDGLAGVGVIAQEIEKILPNSVKRIKKKLNKEDSEETDILGFNPNELTFVMVNAIKELEKENAELRARLAAVEAKVD